MLIEVTKKNDYTNEVMAFDGEIDLLVVDREGIQDVPDDPQVHALISSGKAKEVKVRKGSANAAAADTTADAGEGESE